MLGQFPARIPAVDQVDSGPDQADESPVRNLVERCSSTAHRSTTSHPEPACGTASVEQLADGTPLDDMPDHVITEATRLARTEARKDRVTLLGDNLNESRDLEHRADGPEWFWTRRSVNSRLARTRVLSKPFILQVKRRPGRPPPRCDAA